MLRLLLISLLLAFAAPATGADKPNFGDDAKQPTIGVRPLYASPLSFTFFAQDLSIQGELVLGDGPGPHPAVLFVHWLGDPATTNHTEFEADALELAKRGVTSVLVDAPWSDPKWFDGLGASADADIKSSEQEVIDLRRALAFLLRRDIDPKRVAYVGHDFGAMFGLMLGSVDVRPSIYVLMTPNSSLGEWYLWGKHPADRDAYLAKLAPFDLPQFARQLRANKVLFQFSNHDTYVTPAHAQAIYDAARGHKTLQWFDDDHALAKGEARRARMVWLEKALRLSP